MVIGYVAVKNKRIIAYQKGVNLDVRDIAHTLSKMDYDWVIFHTRLASVGNKTDANCHPFVKDNCAMAMNGTERSAAFLNEAIDITDTEAIFKILTDYKLTIASLANLNSIFVGFKNGVPYVVANNRNNIKILHNKRNNAVVFASEFPYAMKNNLFEITEKYVWCNNRLNHKILKPYKPVKRYYSPYGTSLWDYFYDEGEYSQGYFREISKKGSGKIAV